MNFRDTATTMDPWPKKSRHFVSVDGRELYCELCDIQMCDLENFRIHQNGKRHLMRLQQTREIAYTRDQNGFSHKTGKGTHELYSDYDRRTRNFYETQGQGPSR